MPNFPEKGLVTRRCVSGYLCMEKTCPCDKSRPNSCVSYHSSSSSNSQQWLKSNAAETVSPLSSVSSAPQRLIAAGVKRQRRESSEAEQDEEVFGRPPKLQRTKEVVKEVEKEEKSSDVPLLLSFTMMAGPQQKQTTLTQKLKSTFHISSSSSTSSPVVTVNGEESKIKPVPRGRSKSMSGKPDSKKVKCRDKIVTLTTDTSNYVQWNGHLKQDNNNKAQTPENRRRKNSLFSCTGAGRDLSPAENKPANAAVNQDFYHPADVIYYPNSKVKSSEQIKKSEYYNESKSGFSLRKLLPWRSKTNNSKDGPNSDDSNNNYCIMEKINGKDSKASTQYHHDYCTDLDSKSDYDAFNRTAAIYGTGKRQARRALPDPPTTATSTTTAAAPSTGPPLPPRPPTVPQASVVVEEVVHRRPSVPCNIGESGYINRINRGTPAKEQDVILVKVLHLDFLQKSVISGVAVTRKQEYVVVDLSEAYLVDEDGKWKRTIGNKGSQKLHEPIAVTTMDNGNLVFSDHAHQEVKIYSVRGQYLRKVADPTLCNIAGVAVNDKKQIFIAGTDKQRVSVHTESDELLFTIPDAAKERSQRTYSSRGGGVAKALFEHPYSLAINPLTGDIIVGDDYEQKVTAVSSEGRVLWRFMPACKYTERAFFPCSITVDSMGYVFVADLLNANVYMLDSSGKFLKTLLSRNEGLTGPAAIVTDGRGQLIVADDDRTLKVFRYGTADSAIPRRTSYVQ